MSFHVQKHGRCKAFLSISNQNFPGGGSIPCVTPSGTGMILHISIENTASVLIE